MGLAGNMYEILEKMVEECELGNEDQVRKLSVDNDPKFIQIKGSLSEEIYSNYDHCRASCVMAFDIPLMYDDFLLDAKSNLDCIAVEV